MSGKYDISNIRDLRPSEQVMAYLHQNNISLSPDTPEQLKSDLNMSNLPSDVSEYLSSGVWEYRETEVKATMLKSKRVDLFLHPRFAPVTAHSHGHFEGKYLLSGSANVLVGGQSITLEAGDLIFLIPEVEHMVSIYDADSLLINIVITPDAAASAFPRIYFSDNPLSHFFSAALQGKQEQPYLLCHTGSSETVQNLVLDAYHKSGFADTAPFSLLCESIVEHLMLEVLISHSEDFELNDPLPSVPEKLFPILGYINDHCATVDLASLSNIFNYSQAHLSRIIKQHTGKSFSALLRSARLSHASQLLRSSDLPIQEIMLRAGYNGKAHFYRVFQEAYGMTPAQFRAQEKSSAL